MMKKYSFKKVLSLTFAIAMLLGVLCSCTQNKSEANDIYVIFTGDVHCADDENIGYAGLAAYRDLVKTKSDNVVLVDTGDAIQGDYPGAVTKGEYIINMMNALEYDLAVLGNHEFDYGMERLSELLDMAKATYLGCNITYFGDGKNMLGKVKPYEIRTFGNVNVGFVGVSTPQTMSLSAPSYFKDGDRFVYDLATDDDGTRLQETIQRNVDACRADGADYIIVLSHLGDNATEGNIYNTRSLIAATTGIDVVLDGHAHSIIPCDVLNNKNGEPVFLSSTGTGLNNIGTLVITASGNITVGIVSAFDAKNNDIFSTIESFNQSQEAMLSEKIASCDFDLLTSIGGVRAVRNRETAIGDFVADAFRNAAKSDIAIVNGGGIRADLTAGIITYGDIRGVMPFQNALSSVKATGQEIADALEYSYRIVQKEHSDGTSALGEIGGFLQLSGIKCTVDTSIPSSVTVDDNGLFLSVNGARRVSDIQVLDADGNYYPIDLSKTYTVASHNYMLVRMGDGYSMFADNEFVISEGIIDYQVLIGYLETMNGKIDHQYESPQGRITIK